MSVALNSMDSSSFTIKVVGEEVLSIFTKMNLCYDECWGRDKISNLKVNLKEK